MSRHLPYDRSERVADQLHHIIAAACITDLNDPRLKGIEITKVRMTKDLRIARVYFHLRENGWKEIKQAIKGLRSASGFLKQKVKEEMRFRYMPEFEFFYDESIDLEEKLQSIMTSEEFK